MSDRLVKLYALPDPRHSIENLRDKGIKIRRAMAYEKFQIVEWVRNTFGLPWAGECDVAFSNSPISCFIAASRNSMTAFAPKRTSSPDCRYVETLAAVDRSRRRQENIPKSTY